MKYIQLALKIQSEGLELAATAKIINRSTTTTRLPIVSTFVDIMII